MPKPSAIASHASGNPGCLVCGTDDDVTVLTDCLPELPSNPKPLPGQRPSDPRYLVCRSCFGALFPGRIDQRRGIPPADRAVGVELGLRAWRALVVAS